MHIAFVTAGGAGMFCGSCMQDNALARALMQLGCEVSLIPTYTPIRLDQEDVSDQHVFLGGINLYLDNLIPFWRYLPRPLVSWLDHPRILKWASSRGVGNDASTLGPMTVAMLNGARGPMRREYQDLVDHLLDRLKPDVIVFSNALLSGIMPLLRERFSGPILCLLQGDDLFLNQLPGKYRDRAIAAIGENSRSFAAFITHTRFYADLMSQFLNLDRDRFRQIPLSINARFTDPPDSSRGAESSLPRIGYFARIAPEKGLHNLILAARELYAEGISFELHAGGYLGEAHQDYFERIQKDAEFLGDRFRYVGSPDHEDAKFEFLRQLTVFSVPASYEEPKGLYILEAMAAGVPVVQPSRGSFPELIESTQGGLLYPADDPKAHAAMLKRLIQPGEERDRIVSKAARNVRELHSSTQAARCLMDACEELCVRLSTRESLAG
ncbi:glycosyltransferase family 4 protein [Rubinisphaera margarita]|uniref:glycosyltransferase family 4 protein n=1 Tax=Rubinisphaera margarita TaxID=2909586 RepID=UPI001EE908D6|nr:glycosyltransferase family 4 protein [Rubinisphaera margarita]MCG6155984.1 glycosyltransferase family 4 protein [Rubinisphaera margarita]